ncbi:MAG: MFS transporter [Candidatus Dormibacteraceae bacterium]
MSERARIGRLLALAGLAVLLSAFDGSVLYLALPTISAQFHARLPALSTLGSVVTLGALGALPLSALADRHGRRRLLVLGVAGFGLADLASAFAPQLAWLAGFRLAGACFEALVGGVATALVIEEVPVRHRGLALAWLALAAGLGAGATTLGYPLVAPHWRWLYLAGGAGLPAAGALWAGLPEGRTWARAAAGTSFLVPLRLLWTPPWRRRLAVFMSAAALGSVFYEPAGLFVALFGSRHLALGAAAISEIVLASGVAAGAGFLAGGPLSDRIGRRVPGIAVALGTAVLTAGGFVAGVPGYLAGNVGGSLLAGAAGPIFGAWFAELLPTRGRATAEGALGVAGAAGGIAGLQLVGLMTRGGGLGASVAVLGVLALAGALLYLALPESAGRPLPE